MSRISSILNPPDDIDGEAAVGQRDAGQWQDGEFGESAGWGVTSVRRSTSGSWPMKGSLLIKDSPPMSASSSAVSSESSSRQSFRSSKSTPLTSVSDISLHENSMKKSNILKSKIHRKFLEDKKIVKLAIRRKSLSKKVPISDHHSNSKLHVKALEAGLKVKLTMAPSLTCLYNSLVPHTSKRKVLTVSESSTISYAKNLLSANDSREKLTSKSVHLIDNNLVDLSGVSNKILQTFSLEANSVKNNPKDGASGKQVPTFNQLNTAIHTLFGIDQYTLVRITRSTADDLERSTLLKIETAAPGDLSLIDDHDFFDEMYYSIGKEYESPTNLFIKKVVARPRYKSDMKIYFVPTNINCSLYTDPRMFERDIINGVIDVDMLQKKEIYATFSSTNIINEYRKLVKMSENYRDDQSQSMDIHSDGHKDERDNPKGGEFNNNSSGFGEFKKPKVEPSLTINSKEGELRSLSRAPIAGEVSTSMLLNNHNSFQVSPTRNIVNTNLPTITNMDKGTTFLPDPMSSYYRQNTTEHPVASTALDLSPKSQQQRNDNAN